MTTSSNTSFFPDDTLSVSIRTDLSDIYDTFSLSEAQTSITVFLKKELRPDFIASLRRVADQLEQGTSDAQN